MNALLGVLVGCALTACSSGPTAKTDVKIPTFAPGPSAPPVTTTTTTESVPEQPIVLPPPVTTTTTKPKKPAPPKTTTKPSPAPPTFTIEPPFPPPSDDKFVREGQKCSPENSIGMTRRGQVLVCHNGVWRAFTTNPR